MKHCSWGLKQTEREQAEREFSQAQLLQNIIAKYHLWMESIDISPKQVHVTKASTNVS